MASPPKLQWSSRVVASKSTYKPLRPQYARHGTSEVASTTRDKLDDQASRPQHDLRLLVGHANTLDYLIERLDARQSNRQESKEVIPKGLKQPQDSQEAPPTLPIFPEEANSVVDPDIKANLENKNNNLRVVVIPQTADQQSYFDLSEEKASPALSIVALLGSDSESDDSEGDDGDESSESDLEADNGDDSNY